MKQELVTDKTLKQLGAREEVSFQRIHQVVGHTSPRSLVKKKRIADLARAGKTDGEIAQIMHLSKKTVAQYRRSSDIKPNRRSSNQ